MQKHEPGRDRYRDKGRERRGRERIREAIWREGWI